MYFVQIVRDEVKRHPISNYPVVLAVLTLPPSTEPSSTAIGSIKEPTRSQFCDRGANNLGPHSVPCRLLPSFHHPLNRSDPVETEHLGALHFPISHH